MLSPTDFFNLDDPFTAQFFEGCTYVWDVLPNLIEHIVRLTNGRQTILGKVMTGAHIDHCPMYIGKGARIEPGAYVHGPVYIGEGVVVRHGALVRENSILLAGSVLGHASEIKNSLLLPGAHAPHFNYVGDSILGHRVNLGAGTKLSNLGILSEKDRLSGKRPFIKIPVHDEIYDTGLAKLGAIMGDDSQTGCNSVLNPGCLLGKNSLVYANLSLRKGYHPPNSIIKLRQKTSKVQRRKDRG